MKLKILNIDENLNCDIVSQAKFFLPVTKNFQFYFPPIEWSEWTACSKTCDGGTRYRTRAGEDPDIELCNMQPCETSKFFNLIS